FIAMELVHGVRLTSFIGVGGVSVERKLRWLLEIARALAAAHRVGLVHRDVKPSNVMVGDDDAIKVLDFGIAKLASAEHAVASARGGAEPAGPPSFRPAEGRLVGTPRYMAPEQLRGDAVDARTDQFALGLVAYELLTGVHPRGAVDTDDPSDYLRGSMP